MGDSLKFVPGRKMAVVTNSRDKIYIRETRNKEREPKSQKAIGKFLKEQNGLLKGIIKACRTIPEPLVEQEQDDLQEQQGVQEERDAMRQEMQEEGQETQEEMQSSCESFYEYFENGEEIEEIEDIEEVEEIEDIEDIE